ncbi:MAG: hypothetical protein J6I72_09600 [Muribaculaceae bacterium]|nr:hypothetical protein [Muribaculaceae bacterium]
MSAEQNEKQSFSFFMPKRRVISPFLRQNYCKLSAEQNEKRSFLFFMPKRSVIYPTLLQVERKSKVYFDFSETPRNLDEVNITAS